MTHHCVGGESHLRMYMFVCADVGADVCVCVFGYKYMLYQ